VFPALPEARRLCSGHDAGAGAAGHVDWTLYATDRGPDEVKKFYAGLSGRDPFDEAKAIVQVRRGTAVLTAHPAGARDYPRCGVDPAPSDRTVLVVSALSKPGS
jgi:hypothetical protein